MAKATLRRSNWCFTLNNPTVADVVHLNAIQNATNFQYIVWQKEQGDSGTPHLQGYVEFKRNIRFNTVKTLVGATAHLEPRRGTQTEARNYCMKEEGRLLQPVELGELKELEQGHRSDLDAVVESIKENPDLQEIAKLHPGFFIRYHTGMAKLCTVLMPKRTEPPNVWLFFGPTGTGKTRDAFKMDDVYRKAPDTRWFDGYTNQKTLLLDDFAGRMSKMSLSYLLQLLDRYPINIEVKGAYTPLLCTYIVMTTNIHPLLWYDYSSRLPQYKALARRIHKIFWYKTFGENPMQLTHKSFFDDYFETASQSAIFKVARPPMTRESARVFELSSDSESESDDVSASFEV